MQLTTVDYLIIAGYIALTIGIGFWFRSRAGKNLEQFFVSGRSLPWWIAGTSMVATTFAADTPLAVTGLIVKHGLAGNWFWWAFAAGGMLTVFVYSRMWRRADVMTDVELIRIRYSGGAARWLRYLRATYIALLVNPIIISWVIGAMLTVMQETVFYNPQPAEGSTFWTPSMLAWISVIVMMAVVGIYSTLSGMWGVAISDLIQFCLAMAGCIWLAIVAVGQVGGVDQLRQQVVTNFGDDQAFRYLPELSANQESDEYQVDLSGSPTEQAQSALGQAEKFLTIDSKRVSQPIANVIRDQRDRLVETVRNADSVDPQEQRSAAARMQHSLSQAVPGPWMAVHVFLIMLTMQWWVTWYPGAEPGGGGYVVQRMASCPDERQSQLATLWYQIAHYCIRPWPWIMISFVALAMYPQLRLNFIEDAGYDPGIGFPMVMRELCPPGLAGLMLVAFMAAFMSTISTQMNWGASYLVRDLIQPLFLSPSASDRQLTRISRWVSAGILIVGTIFGYFLQGLSVDTIWKLLASLGAGTGLVFMLRWFWWRINAWSEIVAMLSSLVYFALLSNGTITAALFGRSLLFEETMAVVGIATIATWVLATCVTPAEPEETLRAFFRKIRPGGPGWKPIAKLEPDVKQDRSLAVSIAGAVFASGIVYLMLPAIGFIIFGDYVMAVTCLFGAAICSLGVMLALRRIERDSQG